MEQTLPDRVSTRQAEKAVLSEGRIAYHVDDNADAAYQRLRLKYDDLAQAYRRLQKTHDACRRHIEKANEKYRAAKESARQWQSFIDHQRRKADRLREATAHVNCTSTPAPNGHDPERTPRPLSPLSRPGLSKASTGLEEVFENARHEAAASTEGADDEAELPDLPDHNLDQNQHGRSREMLEARAQRITSSQSTAEGSDPAFPHEVRLSSDNEPQFVSARPVKRRRGNSPRDFKRSAQIKQEPVSPSQPQEIYSEDLNTPGFKRRGPSRQEISDLGAVAGILDAPLRQRDERAMFAEVARPPRAPTMASSLSEGIASDSLQKMVKEEPDSCVGATDPTRTARSRSIALQPEDTGRSARALQPLSANTLRSPRWSGTGNTKRKRQDEDDRMAVAATVAEDGDMDSSQVKVPKKQRSSNSGTGHRLESLLDAPTPGREQIKLRNLSVPKRAIAKSRVTAIEPSKAATPLNPSNEKQKLSPRPVFKMPKTPHREHASASARVRKRAQPDSSPPPPEPEDEPLRCRPPIRLRIEDFKVNPMYKGTDFAFADTIRGKYLRRCLPGCTKLECCGDAFRKAVEMGVKTNKTDAEVLEAYLGPNFRHHMAARTPAEREDVLLKARTYAMSSEHGKHRQAFQRRPSPPGFWRTDMPSTQEEAQDRAKAEEIARQQVYDRWREAIVPGGRWKFRDE